MLQDSPRLDDRQFEDLLAEATRRVRQTCPAWTDVGPSDPGGVLLEAYAFISTWLARQVNRAPAKAYVEFLRLMGLRLYPPRAARVSLQFSLEQPAAKAVVIPELTRVAVARASADTPAPVFMTVAPAHIEAGATSGTALAYHFDWIAAEAAGAGSGELGQRIQLKHPPVLAPIDGFDELIVGVEEPAPALTERAGYRRHGNRMYRLCHEVPRFMDDDDGPGCAFTIDRVRGLISFAPSAPRNADGATAASLDSMAAVPGEGRQILVWYARGAGPQGNVARDTLTVMKDLVPGVRVTNPEPAVGGASAESIESALLRGPQQLHSLERAVTARDFEMLAQRNAGASRAKAFTQADVWAHAVPGTVQILLVPSWPESLPRPDGQVSAERLAEQQAAGSLREIEAAFDELKPLGTRCEVGWVRYKSVRVAARVVVYRGEDPAAVRARVIRNLHEAINPLPAPDGRRGWPFGEPLRISRVYDLILSEKSVNYVHDVHLFVDELPERDARAIAADCHQRGTWYACAGAALFRSMNDGESWERVASFDAPAVLVASHPGCAGVIAAVSRQGDGNVQCKVHVSFDCGESWRPDPIAFELAVEGIAWLPRDDAKVLLIATGKGLYELSVTDAQPTPVQIVVDAQIQDLGIGAVVVLTDVRGVTKVAVSGQANRGVYLSMQGGKPGTFEPIGLEDENIRTLAVQKIGPRSFIWAGPSFPGNEPGSGLHRWEVTDSVRSSEGWRQYGADWTGGSCNSIAFAGGTVYAATHHLGVLKLDSEQQDPHWEAPGTRSGLPAREQVTREGGADGKYRYFLSVSAVAARPDSPLVLAGGEEGVLRSEDGGGSYENVSKQDYVERISLPPTWLFCSGEHDITVTQRDETQRD
ncbi:baseplate J/gp47 family protein [Caballeronia sp. ATUFL_M2_KS44]|uniref:baseplate J/gp47 family protein n=1 Tax=Caballeronia sp. ATUFL_M2_KS44 TaxID=2921767 RepID=UPI002027EF88|nr:baseplate J/gp47 family protein [Caballeronia sp. ATUFL_M2_KS44]